MITLIIDIAGDRKLGMPDMSLIKQMLTYVSIGRMIDDTSCSGLSVFFGYEIFMNTIAI